MGSAYNRFQRKRHIKRKLNKIKTWYSKEEFEKWFNNPEFAGKLDKGKIHCSCPLCKPWKYPPYPEKVKYAAREKEAKKEIKNFL